MRNKTRKHLCCLISVLALPTLVLAQDRAEPDVLRAIEQDARNGAINASDASLLALRAVFDRSALPERYHNLEYKPPRCATSILKAARSNLDALDDTTKAEIEELILGFFPCNNAGFSFHLDSPTHPVSVHYETGADAGEAQAALGFLEDAWDFQVGQLGFTAPLLDQGGCGTNGNLDLYLDRGSDTAYTLDVAGNPSTSWDDFSVFMVIDPGLFGGDLLETTVHHEFNHACQAADDWWEVGAAFESTATLIEEFVDDTINYYVDTIADFNALTRRPYEHNDDYVSFFMYGASLQLLFYYEHLMGQDATFLGDYWRETRSQARGCYCQGARNEPDTLDALSVVLRDRAGVSYQDALIEFSRWRWFVGSNDDGAHFSEGASWPDSVQVSPTRTLNASSLPSSSNVNNGPFPNGASYIVINNTTGAFGPLCISFTPTTSFEAHVETLAVGASGTWTTHDASAGPFGVDLTGVTTLVLKVLHLPASGYDPDFIPSTPGRFRLDFEIPGTCAIPMPCTGDCDDSGAVDFNDLIAMLFEFGNSGDARCDADLSGTVEFNDLISALFAFGPCQ